MAPALEYVPAAHEEQLSVPNVPGAQATGAEHEVAASLEYSVEGHGVQIDAPGCE